MHQNEHPLPWSARPGSLGQQIRRFRLRQGLSQEALAEAVGATSRSIRRWEQDQAIPQPYYYERLCQLFGLDLALFLDIGQHEEPPTPTTPAPPWQVPFARNPYFTGREQILEALHARLGVDQVVALTQSYALHGLGGVGKTQIALEYAYRYAVEYSAIFWVEAETADRIVSSLLRIAEILPLPLHQEQDHQRIVAAVQQWLATHQQWLLICDNAEDLAMLERFLPPARSGAILITTRCQALGTLAQGLDLWPMDQEEGVLLLLRRAKVLAREATTLEVQQLAASRPGEDAAACKLVEALGGLPLALDQAGAYIEETGCSLEGYLLRYKQHRSQLLNQRGALALDHPQSVAATLWLSCQRVAERHPAALELLGFCALFAPDAIPEELLVSNASLLGPVLGPVAADLSRLDQVIAALRRFSLVQRHPEQQTLSMHRLVQAVLLDAMTETEREQWTHRAMAALDALFRDVLVDTEYAAWKQCERLLPHALLYLHRDGYTPDALVFASLAYKAAQYLREQGRYREAEPLFLRAVHIREQVLGPLHPDVGASLNSLAVLYWRQGKFVQAELLWQRALHLLEHILGPDHPDVARPLNNLALLCLEQGHYEEAELLWQRTLHLLEQNLGPDHPSVAHTLQNLAALYQSQGKYEQAEQFIKRALSIRERVLGPEHPDAAYGLDALAKLYIEQGKYDEAESLAQCSLRIREQALGPDHPLIVYSLEHLALVSLKQKKHERAESLFQRTLCIWEQGGQPEHPDVTYALNGLAELYQEQSKDEQAEPLYRRAVRINEQSRGLDHPDVAHSLNGLANLCRVQGKDEEAECLFQRALSIREQRLGPHHPETAQTLHDLALFRQQQGHLDEAMSLAQRALSIRSQSLGEAHPKTVASRILCTQFVQHQAGAAQKAASEQDMEEITDTYSEERQGGKASLPLYQEVDRSSSANDSLQEFLDAYCELHPLAWCRISELWQTYEHWTTSSQKRLPLSRRAFSVQLKLRGCRSDRTSTARIWRGIRLMQKNL